MNLDSDNANMADGQGGDPAAYEEGDGSELVLPSDSSGGPARTAGLMLVMFEPAMALAVWSKMVAAVYPEPRVSIHVRNP